MAWEGEIVVFGEKLLKFSIVFISLIWISAAVFASGVLESELVEYTSVPSNNKLEESRIEFLQARGAYQSFYVENKQIIEGSWALLGSMSGIERVRVDAVCTNNLRVSGLLASAYKECDVEYEELTERNAKIFEEFESLKEVYESSCARFLSFAPDYVGISGARIKRGLRDRLGFDCTQTVCFHTQKAEREWRAKVSQSWFWNKLTITVLCGAVWCGTVLSFFLLCENNEYDV